MCQFWTPTCNINSRSDLHLFQQQQQKHTWASSPSTCSHKWTQLGHVGVVEGNGRENWCDVSQQSTDPEQLDLWLYFLKKNSCRFGFGRARLWISLACNIQGIKSARRWEMWWLLTACVLVGGAEMEGQRSLHECSPLTSLSKLSPASWWQQSYRWWSGDHVSAADCTWGWSRTDVAGPPPPHGPAESTYGSMWTASWPLFASAVSRSFPSSLHQAPALSES